MPTCCESVCDRLSLKAEPEKVLDIQRESNYHGNSPKPPPFVVIMEALELKGWSWGSFLPQLWPYSRLSRNQRFENSSKGPRAGQSPRAEESPPPDSDICSLCSYIRSNSLDFLHPTSANTLQLPTDLPAQFRGSDSLQVWRETWLLEWKWDPDSTF